MSSVSSYLHLLHVRKNTLNLSEYVIGDNHILMAWVFPIILHEFLNILIQISPKEKTKKLGR